MVDHIEISNIDRRDLFISHASEDKEEFVRPLVQALTNEGLTVWFDEYELRIGDSLRGKIDEGLSRSRYGLVVLSQAFFAKGWPQYEMDGLIARQTAGERVILPIWHRLTKDEIAQQSPSLTDIVALNSSVNSVGVIASRIASVVSGSPSAHPTFQPTTQSHDVARAFGVFYVAAAGTEEPPAGPIEQHPLGWLRDTDRWMSVVASDQELEYLIQGQTLRVQLNWGSTLQGDEILAQGLMVQGEPFALTIRPSTGKQIYFPSVRNATPRRNWMLSSSSPSGWMAFKIR